MMINWSTVLFQIINFIILVFLLRKFLYGPIVTVMNQREEEILNREATAQQKAQEATESIEDYKHRIQIFENEKADRLKQMKQEVKQQKHELVSSSKEEISQLQKQWQEDVARQANTYMEQLKEQLGKHACTLAQKTLHDLADAKLESVVFDVFIKRLHDLQSKEYSSLIQAIKQDNHVRLVSNFEVSTAQKQIIETTLNQIASEPVTFTYSQDNQIGCGYVLEFQGYRIAWNTKHYLSEIEKDILVKLPELNKGVLNEAK